MYHGDVVGLQIQLGGFRRYAFGDLVERVSRASNHSAGADARRWTVAFAETSLVVLAIAFKFMMRQLLDGDVLHLCRCGTARWSARELFFPQPIREPGQVAVACERIRC